MRDEHGRVYELGESIGKTGGQGRVHRVKGASLAVKILHDTSSSRREQLRAQLAAVKRLPVEDLPMARPLAMLKEPHLGYVMDLVTGMEPIAALLSAPREGIARWYIETGGLGRRLRLLTRIADAFARLHGRSLVYSDPSPSNLLVTRDLTGDVVRLIDADNLHVRSGPSIHAVYTPFYGAPELVRGEVGPDTRTDTWAFGVIAFQTLTLIHPMLGDEVVDGEPQLEERALAGERPWIDAEPPNNTNASSRGLPRADVLSTRLRELCAGTFGDGRLAPEKRPTMTEWAERLEVASGFLLPCSVCKATFYASSSACPFCASPRPAFVLARMDRWEPGRMKEHRSGLTEREGMPGFVVPVSGKYLVSGRIARAADEDDRTDTPWLELTFESVGRGRARALGGAPLFLSRIDGSEVQTIGDKGRSFPVTTDSAREWILHFGPVETPHRVARFVPFDDEAAR